MQFQQRPLFSDLAHETLANRALELNISTTDRILDFRKL